MKEEAPLDERRTTEFPYKHSTGETIGRFLAGLKEQKRIWGEKLADGHVVVPPVGYDERNGGTGGTWIEVKPVGTVTAVARVQQPIAKLHPSERPFAFVLVKLDGADTAMAHVVTGDVAKVRVGSRVEAVWKADAERVGSIRDIATFKVI